MPLLVTLFSLLVALGPSLCAAEDIGTSHPLAAKVQEFRKARKVDSAAAAREFYAEDSRVWYEKKEGPGRKRGPAGTGPWAQWDRYFRGETSLQEMRVEGRAVTIVILENNEFYQLIEQPPKRVNITYFFGENDLVDGTLIASGESPPDRYDEAVAWAREHHLEEINSLMPEDRIVPSLENAQRWRRLLNTWRREVGLPAIEE